MNPEFNAAEMPKYKCHKEVWALKIKRVDTHEAGATLHPVDTRYAPIEVDATFFKPNQKLEVGGYYVVYADGYKSYSPAKAFEDGYTLITP